MSSSLTTTRARSRIVRFGAAVVLVVIGAACSAVPDAVRPPPRAEPVAPTATTAVPTPSGVAATQRLVVLDISKTVMSSPAVNSARLGIVEERRPITRERTVLPVLATTTAADGRSWLDVRLPGRPNGHTGWITTKGTQASSTRWHLVVDTTTRRVLVYDKGREVRTFIAIVGSPTTPTPLGEYFVEEDVKLSSHEVGAPYALALSARSNVLQEFDGGPGQIALHGLENIGGVLGTAVSHGCVRLSNDALAWLQLRIGPGVPVTITR